MTRDTSKTPGFGRRGGSALLALLASCAIPACAPTRGEIAGADTLTIGAYSVVREAFHEGILPAFARHWEAKTGRTVRFEESYNASGAQSRAIASGFDADIAVLSLEPDITRLVKAKLVKHDWKAGPTEGVVSRSLVVIGVRPGNPKEIKDWGDLTKPDVGVLYPDPKTSGGARWNINAIYGAGLLTDKAKGGKPNLEAARDLLARVQERVVNMDASGRQSMATFERGTGDAVVTYENELILQQRLKGDDLPYVIPPATLLIESPAAIVEDSVQRHGNRAVAEAFLAFLRSEEAQRLLVHYGFRPLDPKLDTAKGRQPLPPKLFTMKDLGGWSRINKEVYDAGGVWDSLFTLEGSQ
ncbi:MAG TPA: sulfate ABC transporter substrate-binding protein [Isosphaeraceae bacterium]|nr:sulfate ABC transporter substrate-binding protein [Isosphaeraceae bacterium]